MIRGAMPELSDGAVRLREVTPSDSEDLYRWRMDPGSRGMFRQAGEVSFESHQAYLSRYFEESNTDRWFIIEAGGVAVGAVALYDISADGSEAEWGRLVVAPDRRRRGHGERAVRLLVRHAREIGIRRLRCEVRADNAAAAGMYRRIGFEESGFEEVEGRRFVTMRLALGAGG